MDDIDFSNDKLVFPSLKQSSFENSHQPLYSMRVKLHKVDKW